MSIFKTALAVFVCIVLSPAHAASQTLLEPVADIAMPNVNGRIDHLAFDAQHSRLFVAALGNNTIEVLDLNAKRSIKSISGFGEPQGVLYLPGLNRVYVTNGSANRVDVLDASSLQIRKRFEALEDADNIRYDDIARKVYVGYGRGALSIIDPESEQTIATIRLSAHPESFQLERAGNRVFVNVPGARHVAVIDRDRRAVIATWKTAGASNNYPMALDESTHRLFVGTRSPPVLLVYDTSSGNVVAQHPIGEDTDDIFFDTARKRVYVICGEGRVDMFQQQSADRYSLMQSIKTWPGARTGLFVEYFAAVCRRSGRVHVLCTDACLPDSLSLGPPILPNVFPVPQ